MPSARRLIVATLSGVLFGFVCLGLASSGPNPIPWPAAADIIANRTLIGLAIGLSAFSIVHWSLHGLFVGAIFSLPLAFSTLLAPENPHAPRAAMFAGTIILGAIYGLLIELICLLFKARMPRPS